MLSAEGTISYYLAKGIVKLGPEIRKQIEADKALARQIDELVEESEKVVEEVAVKNRKWVELFSTIEGRPINKKLLLKLQSEFAEVGGDMRFDKESFEYIASREKVLGVEIEAITLGDDLIMLGPKATTSAVYEELIHARQFRTGEFEQWVTKYGNKIAENLMEKSAAEELLTNSNKWKLPKDEIKLINERLDYFINELKKLGYEN